MGSDHALRALLKQQAGVIARRQVAPEKLEFVRWQRESGRWQSVHRGLFVSHSGSLTREQWLWVALLGGGPGAALCGPTAAEVAGLKGFETRVIHVCVPYGRRGPDIAGVRYHPIRSYESTVAPNRVPRRIALPHALIAMAGAARTESRAHDVLTAAVQQSLVRTSDLRAALETKPKAKCRALIAETLLDIDGGAQSLNEIAMLKLLRKNRLPAPQLQIPVATARRRSRIDGGWPQYAVCFEIDGTGHFEVGKWADDADRQNEVALAQPTGTTLLRWPGFVVRRTPDIVAAQVRRALLRGGWLPGLRPVCGPHVG